MPADITMPRNKVSVIVQISAELNDATTLTIVFDILAQEVEKTSQIATPKKLAFPYQRQHNMSFKDTALIMINTLQFNFLQSRGQLKIARLLPREHFIKQTYYHKNRHQTNGQKRQAAIDACVICFCQVKNPLVIIIVYSATLSSRRGNDVIN